MNCKTKRLFLSLGLGLGLTLGLLGVLGNPFARQLLVRAAGPRYVAPTGDDSGNDCANNSAPCATIQHAVDMADSGDDILVATGIYTDVHMRPRNDLIATGMVTQMVYISKTMTIRGGYTTGFTALPDPVANPAILDAQGQGRVLYITGDISPTIEGLQITGGSAAGLIGDPSGEDAGGGVYAITATINFSNNQVFSNTTVAGGGLYFLNSANVRLTGNTITNNMVFARAGGLYFRNSPGATLIDNTISNNRAGIIGGGTKHHGGVYFLSSDNATLINNMISGNSAADTCGGGTFRSGSNNTHYGKNSTLTTRYDLRPSGDTLL